MEDWNEKLITAARTGDSGALKLCLQNDADIDYQGVGGRTALMFAACEGQLEICRLLIDTGCKIHTTDTEDGWTALMFAANEGHLEICRLLIDKGCKIDTTTEDGLTALMFAASGGHLEICKLLIDKGCKIDTTTTGDGWTALMFPAWEGHLEICKLLIDKGCKIDTTTRDGYTALHWAAECGHLQTTRCLVEQGGASPLVTTHKGQTPYNLAAAEKQGQYREVMEYLQVRVRVKAGKRDHSNVSEEPPSKRSLREFTEEQINFTKMGIIVLNILAEASYDLLKPDKPNLRPRSDYDISHLYQEHFKLKKHIPTNGWGGILKVDQVTGIATGDDIERIRLTRNELQHSRAAELGNTRFNELYNILSDLLKRFDQLNKPARLYTDQLNEIMAKTMSAQEVQSIENEILGVDITIEIDNPMKVQT